MLDTYIIDQIRREQERTRSDYIPLYIEPPSLPLNLPRDEDEPTEETPEHGVLIIDYFSDPDD